MFTKEELLFALALDGTMMASEQEMASVRNRGKSKGSLQRNRSASKGLPHVRGEQSNEVINIIRERARSQAQSDD